MTDYSKIDFSPLIDSSEDEVVTEAFVNDVPLPSGGTLALITLDNGHDQIPSGHAVWTLYCRR